MSEPAFDYFAHCLTNAQVARALGYIAPRLDSELAMAIMHEGARRLSGEPHIVGQRLPDLPPLDATDAPDADATPLGLFIDQIAYEAVSKVR